MALEEMNKLEKMAQPLVEYLNTYGNPYTRIEITLDKVSVVEEKAGIPVRLDD
jgi:hypothetical protein